MVRSTIAPNRSKGEDYYRSNEQIQGGSRKGSNSKKEIGREPDVDLKA